MRLLILNLILLVNVLLSANDELPQIIDLKADPITIVGGVHLISGRVIEGGVDLQAPGPAGVRVERRYSGGNLQQGTLRDNWDLGFHNQISFYQRDLDLFVELQDRGADLSFINKRRPNNKFDVEEAIFGYGVANGLAGPFSGRVNLKNRKIIRNSSKSSELRMESGEVVRYQFKESLNEFDDVHRAKECLLPNGIRETYDYTGEKLAKISSFDRSGKLVDEVKITYPKDLKREPIWKIVNTKNETSVLYHFKRMESKHEGKHRYMLDRVESDHFPPVEYDYKYLRKSRPERLTRKRWPDGRFVEFEYHNTTEDKSSWYGRVNALYQPGIDGKPVKTYQFTYALDKVVQKSNPIGGTTLVEDALGNKTSYTFSKKHPMREIVNYDKNGAKLRREHFVWGKKGTNDYTNLRARYVMNKDGKIEKARTFKYDEDGNMLEEVVSGNLTGAGAINAETWAVRYTYTPQRLLETERDGDRKTTYRYWKGTDLVKWKITSFANEFFERCYYEYDGSGAVSVEIVDDGNVEDIHNLSQVSHRKIKRIKNSQVGLPLEVDHYYFDFKEKQEVFTQKISHKWSLTGDLLERAVFDRNGKHAYTESFRYNKMGKPIWGMDREGNVTEKEYDANGNCIVERSHGVETVYVYDFCNRLIKKTGTHPDGYSTFESYGYDTMGQLIWTEDHLGNRVEKTYDELGRVIQVLFPNLAFEEYTYDILNNRIYSKDRGEGETHSRFTVRGLPYEIRHPDGGVTKKIYHLDGTLSYEVDPLGVETRYAYDGKKRVIKQETISSGVVVSTRTWRYSADFLLEETDPEGLTIQYFYNDSGQLERKTQGDLETCYAYDDLGREWIVRERISATTWKQTEKLYDVMDRVVSEKVEDMKETKNTYDERGNLTKVSIRTNDGWVETTTRYNSRNLPVETVLPDGTSIYTNYFEEGKFRYIDQIDQLGVVRRQCIDALGSCVKEETLNPLGACIQRSSFTFDGAGKALLRVDEAFSDGQAIRESKTKFAYDLMGRLIEMTEPDGRETRKGYSTRGELIWQIKPDGVKIDYHYDELGRQSEVISDDGSLHDYFTYNKNGVLAGYRNQEGTVSIQRTLDSHGRVVKEDGFAYAYDGLGRVVSITYPDGSDVKYTYDALRLREIQRGNFFTNFNFDRSGKLLSKQLPGDQIEYSYDLCLRPVSFKSKNYEQEMSYDNRGNVNHLQVRDGTGTFEQNYEYDLLNQLISERGHFSHNYRVDSLHNRLEKDGESYMVDAANKLLSTGREELIYDLNGNQTGSTQSEFCYRYDPLDRLVALENDQTLIEYRYDGLHRRREKIQKHKSASGRWVVTSHDTYLFQGDCEVGRRNQEGKILELRVLGIGKGAGVGQTVAIEKNQKRYIPLHDHRGNIVGLQTESGISIEWLRFGAFGEKEVYGEAGLSPWTFSSKRYEEELGWYDFGRRWYNPETGRFTTPDPLLFEDGYNRYSYVHNRPLNFVDPYGTNSMCAMPMFFQTEAKKINYRKCYEFEANRNAVRSSHTTLYTNGGPIQSPPSPVYNSGCYEVEGRKDPRFGIGFINGILNTPEMARESAELVKRLCGGSHVYGVYNSTGGLEWDRKEYFMNLDGVCTTPVMYLHETWDNFFSTYDSNALFIQIAHSQGAALVRNALATYSEELAHRIVVLAVAPGAYIDPNMCKKVLHLVSTWDIVPLLDFENKIKYEDVVKYINAHPDAPWVDHPFGSPTFKDDIKGFYEQLIQQNNSIN